MSSAILVSISDLRKQYLDILIDIGFVNDANMSSVNVHSKVARVIKAAVVSGLYPQIATVQLPDIRFVCVFFFENLVSIRAYWIFSYIETAHGVIAKEVKINEVKFFTSDGEVFLHPSSSLHDSKKIDDLLLV